MAEDRTRAASKLRMSGTKPMGLVSEVRLLGRAPNLLRATCRNLYIMRWTGACGIQDLNEVFREISNLADRYPTVAVISLLDQGCQPPTTEGREVIARHQARMGERVAIGNLVDGQGFWASIVLNALIGIKTMKAKSKSGPPEKVFRQRQDACLWLQGLVDRSPAAREIDRVIEYCRSVGDQSGSTASMA